MVRQKFLGEGALRLNGNFLLLHYYICWPRNGMANFLRTTCPPSTPFFFLKAWFKGWTHHPVLLTAYMEPFDDRHNGATS
jgi:hypothetical protein